MSAEPENPRDFATLYRTTITPLRRYLARFLGSRTEAQDVAHDAYLRVYPAMEDHTARKPQALLYTTARRLALNRIKRQHHAPIVASTDHPETAPTGDPGVVQQVMARQEWHELEEAIARLPAGCRSVLLLRKVELLSHQAIADRLGLALSTVEKQHARALRLLREDLAQTTDRAIPVRGTEATP
ncbi:MAG: RNA polymerase sigma factor [Opitutales bacterium]